MPASSPRCARHGRRSRYGQVEETIVIVSTLSFGALAEDDVPVVVDGLVVVLELPDIGSTVPATVTL